ncbi:MAG: rRNA maturation RNase YbeY [Desulfomonile tiedjei]|uniref:Endoribonuclease YbeY n=1 Tax=Desulfomonile tiedjei TaxID=2358 RepID=A0A9D6UYB5_9BACT|nr:rRNA maturation RNase YbeY [Desulfomonile tiedjei]
MEILIDNRQTRIKLDQQELRKKTERILEDLGCDPSSMISVAIVDSSEMADLNYKFRGKEGPTNVLSFSQTEGAHKSPHPGLLGDVVICGDRAADDAVSLNYTTDEMTLYLLIHGVLHLVGYEHQEPLEATTMEQKVEQIFQQFYPSEISR